MLAKAQSLAKWRVVSGYTFATAIIMSVFLAKYALRSVTDNNMPVVLLIGAIVVIARYTGFGPSIFATLIAALGVNYLFMPPYSVFSFSFSQVTQLSVFGIEALCAAYLVTTIRLAKIRYESKSAHVNSLQLLVASLAKATSTSEVASVVTRESARAFVARATSTFTLDLKTERLECIGRSASIAADRRPDTSTHLFVLEAERIILKKLRTAPPEGLAGDEESVMVERAHYFVRSSDEVRDLVVIVMVRSRGGKLTFLALAFPGAREFSADDESLARTYARQYAAALDRCHLIEAEREVRAQADAFHDEAEVAKRVKDEFLGIVSHELRTPLNAIIGWVQLIQNGTNADRDQAKYGLEVIRRNAKAQVKIIEDLLDVSQIVAGKLVLETRPVVLDSVLRAAVDMIRPPAAAKRINMFLDIEENIIVIGDADRLQQMIGNLLTNALNFSSEGGQISVYLSSKHEVACLRVVDNGRGIEADDLQVIFDRFRQIDCSTKRLHRGLGLGLAIVRSLAEAHRGHVHAASEGLGQGATFTVQLPLFNTTKTITSASKTTPLKVDRNFQTATAIHHRTRRPRVPVRCESSGRG